MAKQRTAKKRNFVFYRGPSMIDGAPIIAIATITRSSNEKTGAMVQTWILRADMNPIAASRTGADVSICGNCRHRGRYDLLTSTRIDSTRSCYVRLDTAPNNIWKTERRGRYLDLSCDLPAAAERVAGKKVRLGSYGDPAAVPFIVWETFLEHVLGKTGYTHQWLRFPEFAAFCMASCDTSEERLSAHMLGFRTFRVASLIAWKKEAGEALCPASEQAGKKTTCIDCQACGGNDSKAKADIVIPAHGGGKRLVTGAAA